MKFFTILILSISLLATSSFAVSLTPPLVLKMQEDRSMAASEGVATENDFSPFRYLAGGLSIGIGLGGFMLMIIGCSTINNEDYNRTDSKIAIGAGIGMMVLGGAGVIWAF